MNRLQSELLTATLKDPTQLNYQAAIAADLPMVQARLKALTVM